MSDAAGVGQRLDRLAISRFHVRLIGLIAAGMFFDSFDIYLASGVLGAMLRSGQSTLSLNATFISVTFGGMMVGAWMAGILGDRYGRRFCYQFNLALYGVASLVGALAPSMQWLILCRLVMGFGMGAEIVVGYGTLGEFIPARHRGRFGTILNLIINSALFLSTFLGWLIIPRFGWRWMFVIAGAGAVFVWFLRKSMPESPRWLVTQGRSEDADRIVRSIEAEGRVHPQATAADTIVARTATGTARAGDAPAPLKPLAEPLATLFGPALLARTVTGITVTVGLLTVNYAFVSWIPSFLVRQGHTLSSSLGITALMFAGGPFGSLIALAISERLGRKWGIVLFSAVGIVLGAAYPFAASPAALAAAGFAITGCIYVLSSLSIATYVPELFPTVLRMRGAGLCNALGRAASMGVPFVVVWAFETFGISGVVALICGTLLTQGVIVALLGPETRRRSLEELEQHA